MKTLREVEAVRYGNNDVRTGTGRGSISSFCGTKQGGAQQELNYFPLINETLELINSAAHNM